MAAAWPSKPITEERTFASPGSRPRVLSDKPRILSADSVNAAAVSGLVRFRYFAKYLRTAAWLEILAAIIAIPAFTTSGSSRRIACNLRIDERVVSIGLTTATGLPNGGAK